MSNECANPVSGFNETRSHIRSLTGPRGARDAPRADFFPFREKIDSILRAPILNFCFEWSRLSGGRPPAPLGGPLSTKNGRIWEFFWALRALNPPKITKILRKCYNLTQKFNENLIFDMCFLAKIQPFLTKMMENYGKFTKFTLDKAFIL